MSSEWQKPTTHVIFDFGNTVADLVTLLNNMLKQYVIGFDSESSAAKSCHVALKEVDTLSEFTQALYESFNFNIDGDSNVIQQTIVKYLLANTFPLLTGIEKLLKHLNENNIPMAIATNTSRHSFDHMSANCVGYDHKYFSHVVCGADDPHVKVNKPAPDIFLVCAQRFKTPPKTLGNCVIFEDSVRGVTGALSTGMKTVLINPMINDSNIKEFQKIKDKITLIADSFDNFNPESIGLPPYPKTKLA